MYNPNNPLISNTFNGAINMLQGCEKMKDALKDLKIIKKQRPSLKIILNLAKFENKCYIKYRK